MEQRIISIWYDDNDGSFTDEFGTVEYDITDIMPFDQVMFYKREGGAYYSIMQEHNGVIFKIEFPTRDIDRLLYYDLEENIMIDEAGNAVFNLYNIIRPNDFMMFRRNKESVIVVGIWGGYIELVWPHDYE